MTATLDIPQDRNIRLGIGFDEIVSIMRQRRSQDSILITAMIDIRDRYNGAVILPVPDVQGAPDMEPPVPRLIALAIDGTAMRAASPSPTIVCPAMRSDKVKDVKNANTRRRMLYAKWHENQVKLKLYRSYRHLVGYGTNAFVVMPDEATKSAKLELRDPLTCYPELRAPDDVREPRNVGFIYGRSIDWICAHFEKARGFFFNAAAKNWDTLWDVVEWVDEDEVVIGIMGPRMPAYSPQDARPYGYNGFELARWRNKAGCVPAVVPRRVTLDLIQGQMSTMIGTVDLHARMTALEVLMAEKHVFPDMVIMSAENATAKVVSGAWRDGRTGEVNIVNDARGVQYLNASVSPFVPSVVGGLEESIRESGGASPMTGGSDFNGARTGRAIDEMGAFSVDPRVEEAQRIMSEALTVANGHLIEVEKGYFPQSHHWSFTGLQGDDQMVEYVPSKDLDSHLNVVAYPVPGADISQTSVAVSQLSGAGLISKHTARVKHPWIDDAELEEAQIAEEMFESALAAGAAQQLKGGQMPINDGARILELLRGGDKIEVAIQTAHNEAQKRQAQQAPPPGPGQATAPQTQPGLASPGMGAEQPPDLSNPAIPPSTQALANLHGIVRNLNSTPVAQPTGGPAST